MTTEEKLKVRTELATILVRYGVLKDKLENPDDTIDLPAEELKNRIDLLDQVWHQSFVIWDSLEKAMSLEKVSYHQIEPAISQSTAVFNETLNRIEAGEAKE